MTAPTRKTPEADTKPADDVAAETWPKSELTVGEMIDSFTGWDEIAIEEHLKKPIEGLGSNYTLTRAAIALHRTREGDKPAAAFKAAMEMTNRDVQRYFTPKTANDNDLLAPSEAGKGASKR